MTFTASANSNSDPRTARITITYSYTLGGSRGTATADVTVAQSCGDQPVISVSPTGIAAEIEGGTYSFTYTIVNPTADGVLSANSSASWISNIIAGTGSVTFDVGENTGSTMRTATITLSYIHSGGTTSESVTVMQDHLTGGSSTGGELVGTYVAHGLAYGQGISPATETDWTLKIYPYEGDLATENTYEYWVDGIVPNFEDAYAINGDHRCSAGAYVASSGSLHIPTQMANGAISSTTGTYYLMYTPCVDYDGTNWYYSGIFPDLVFTYNESKDCWESNYGVFMGGATDYSISTFATWFQAVAPTITLTKKSDTTSLSVADDQPAKPLLEGLESYSKPIAEEPTVQ